MTVTPETDRFDNLSTLELARRHVEALREHLAVRRAIEDRLRRECSIEIGKVYRVADDGKRFAGRMMLVNGIIPHVPGVFSLGNQKTEADCYAVAEGRLNGKSTAGDGYTLRHQQVRASRLEPC